ncbi:MAG TPA: hypothetical protein DIC19_02755 [Erysipelotrichaceae bacterium]|nr:hypothetical protein [Erysipelotrichaceae bacterium]
MNVIYILLTNTRSMLSRSIQLFTNDPYNHVSLVLNEDFTEIYSFGRLKKENPLIGGFVNEFQTKIYDHFEKTNCLILSIDLTDFEYTELRNQIGRFKYHTTNFKYNIVGYAGFLVNYPIKRKKAYFCSQFVGELLQNSGIVYFDKPIELLKPNDFARISNTKKLYEGPFNLFEPSRKISDEMYNMIRLAMINLSE